MKANILLNYYNFDGEWARETLEPYVKGRVLILPLAYREHDIYDNESWQRVYGEGGEVRQYHAPFLQLRHCQTKHRLAKLF